MANKSLKMHKKRKDYQLLIMNSGFTYFRLTRHALDTDNNSTGTLCVGECMRDKIKGLTKGVKIKLCVFKKGRGEEEEE